MGQTERSKHMHVHVHEVHRYYSNIVCIILATTLDGEQLAGFYGCFLPKVTEQISNIG